MTHFSHKVLIASRLAQSAAASAWKPEVVGSNPTKSNWESALQSASILQDAFSTLCAPLWLFIFDFFGRSWVQFPPSFLFILPPLPPCIIFSFFFLFPPPLFFSSSPPLFFFSSKSYKKTFLYFLKANLRFESISLNSAIGE